jgi:hypothetical protein
VAVAVMAAVEVTGGTASMVGAVAGAVGWFVA